jgi:hypothetical protein
MASQIFIFNLINLNQFYPTRKLNKQYSAYNTLYNLNFNTLYADNKTESADKWVNIVMTHMLLQQDSASCHNLSHTKIYSNSLYH